MGTDLRPLIPNPNPFQVTGPLSPQDLFLSFRPDPRGMQVHEPGVGAKNRRLGLLGEGGLSALLHYLHN